MEASLNVLRGNGERRPGQVHGHHLEERARREDLHRLPAQRAGCDRSRSLLRPRPGRRPCFHATGLERALSGDPAQPLHGRQPSDALAASWLRSWAKINSVRQSLPSAVSRKRSSRQIMGDFLVDPVPPSAVHLCRRTCSGSSRQIRSVAVRPGCRTAGENGGRYEKFTTASAIDPTHAWGQTAAPMAAARTSRRLIRSPRSARRCAPGARRPCAWACAGT